MQVTDEVKIMKLFNLKKPEQKVSFEQAVKLGLGDEQGLFFPEKVEPIANIDELLALPLVERSAKVLSHLLDGELDDATIFDMVSNAFTFPAPVTPIGETMGCLELFHGPTLAFKDFGARFMAQCLSTFATDQKLTIVTATSGDTGAAVAHAFHGLDNINVVILYPKGKISLLQEKLFCTLGGNIKTLAVEGTFDNCQAMVKQAFLDDDLKSRINLNSANSINISRLLAQVCYYFEAVSQLSAEQRENLVVSVPSGNFGNLTAGIIGKLLGLPIKRFVAATNVNDTVPRYLKTNEWKAKETIPTLSNAMDVSEPNNWPRVDYMREAYLLPDSALHSMSIDEEQTQMGVRALERQGYTSEPHAAVAYEALKHNLQEGEFGLFLGTAHPAKFKESVENILGSPIPLPAELAAVATEEILSDTVAAQYEALRDAALAVNGQ